MTSTTTATFEVTDGSGGYGKKTFTFEPRRQCWLAYLSQPGGSGLQLFDPVLGTRRAFSDHEADEAASDFRFSPDGQRLAFRLKAASGRFRISVRAAPDWHEVPLEIPGSVERYAWAPGSDLLALGIVDDGATWLTGVAFPSSEQAIALEPVETGILSDLVWFGDGFLGFTGLGEMEDERLRVPFATRLAGDRFAPPTSIEILPLDPSVQLEGRRSGLFAVSKSEGSRSIIYYDFSGLEPEDQPQETIFFGEPVLAPSGDYTAKAPLTTLDVYGLLPRAPAIAQREGCSYLLGWATESERIACFAMPDTGSEVRIFDLQASAPEPASRLSSRTVSGVIEYPENMAIHGRRALSPSGDWLALATDSHLYSAKLVDSAPFFFRADDLLGLAIDDLARGRVELAFSANEKFLIQHRSSQLSYHSLVARNDTPHVLQAIHEYLPTPRACEPTYRDGPREWCGSSLAAPAAFALSPDSRFVAFKNTGGGLKVKEMHVPYEPSPALPVDSSCGDGCSFSFQP